MSRETLGIAILLSLLLISGSAFGDGTPDRDPALTINEDPQNPGSLLEDLISSGSMNRPAIYQGRLFYHGQSLHSIPLDSMNELLRLYTDEELLDVTEIAWSSCKFERIEGLDRLPNLRVLRLGGNRIAAISGLESCPQLEILGLSQNRIDRIEGLESVPNLRELSLSNNKIVRIEGLDHLRRLEVLMLEGNLITKIEGMEQLPALKRLGLAGNRLRDVGGLLGLGDLNDISIRSLDNQLDEKALEIIAEWNRRHSDKPFAQL